MSRASLTERPVKKNDTDLFCKTSNDYTLKMIPEGDSRNIVNADTGERMFYKWVCKCGHTTVRRIEKWGKK